MEEYNLNRDADSYASALAAYNAGINEKARKQQDLDKQAEQADQALDTPLEMLGGELIRKPAERLGEKALGTVVKKFKTEVGTRARQALSDASDRVTQAIADHTPATGEGDSVVRRGINALRDRLNMRPLNNPEPSAEAPAAAPAPAAPAAPAPAEPAPTAAPAPAAPAPAEPAPQINVDDISTKRQAQEATNALRQRLFNLSPAQRSEVNSRFKADPAKLDIPDKGTVPNRVLDRAYKNNVKTLNGHINDVENADTGVARVQPRRALEYATRERGIGARLPGQPADAQGQADRIRLRSSILQEAPAPAPSATEAPAPAPAEPPAPAPPAPAPAPPAADDAPPPAADDAPALEEGAEGADAAAAAEGGLDPIADILALVLGIGTAVAGATHHSVPKLAQFNPINPSIQHGI